MLNLRKFLLNYEKGARSLAELVPWMILVRPDMVLNKDMSLLVCYAFEGIDSEGMEDQEIDRYAALVQHAYRNCNEHVTVWTTVVRRRTRDYPEGTFPDPISRFLDDEWKKTFTEGMQYSNRHYLSLLYSPSGGNEGFWGMVGYFTRMENHGYIRALLESFKACLLKRWSFALLQGVLDRNIREFGDVLKSVEDALTDIHLVRLENQPLLEFLHDRVSPASDGQPVAFPNIPAYLDGFLADNDLKAEDTFLRFRHNETVYAAVMSIKDWPQMTWPGVYDELLSIPGEITLSQVFRFVERGRAEKYIRSVEKHNRFLQVPLVGHLKAAWSQQPARVINPGRSALARDAGDALSDLTTGDTLFGYYNLSLVSFGASKEVAEETLKQASRILQRQGYLTVRESMHIRSAWAGTLPGQWAVLVRWWFVHTANLADLSPVRTLSTGKKTNPYLSEQLQSPMPALTVLPTQFATPFYFNFHVGDLAHTLVLGPSRTGKSVLDNFLISQFRKYPGNRVVIFDKDYSCRIPTLLQGGQHIDLEGSQDLNLTLNPILQLQDRQNWRWIISWLEILISSRGYRMTAEDDGDIWQALEQVHEMGPALWKLQAIPACLPRHLRENLLQWVGQGQFAPYFDHEQDSFSLGDFTCIEMGGLFRYPRVASAFLDYAFFRIHQQLDGAPTLIYIEEAWFMLSDTVFENRIEAWLRTLAKKNAFVLLATQSLDEVAESRIFAVMIDNIPNRIYLANANANAHLDLYVKQFGLNVKQVAKIRGATPKRHYYMVTPICSRMVDMKFPPGMLACLRSDTLAQRLFDQHRTSGRPDWKRSYIEEISGSESPVLDLGFSGND